MTGPHVTTSSRETTDSSDSLEPRRNTSIHTEVSTRTTAVSSGAVDAAVLASHRQVALPQAAAGQCQDAVRLGATHEFFERPFDRRGVGPFAADADRLLEELLIKHKIC